MAACPSCTPCPLRCLLSSCLCLTSSTLMCWSPCLHACTCTSPPPARSQPADIQGLTQLRSRNASWQPWQLMPSLGKALPGLQLAQTKPMSPGRVRWRALQRCCWAWSWTTQTRHCAWAATWRPFAGMLQWSASCGQPAPESQVPSTRSHLRMLGQLLPVAGTRVSRTGAGDQLQRESVQQLMLCAGV